MLYILYLIKVSDLLLIPMPRPRTQKKIRGQGLTQRGQILSMPIDRNVRGQGQGPGTKVYLNCGRQIFDQI